MKVEKVVARELEELLNNDSISVKKTIFVPGMFSPRGTWEQDTFYVLYEEAEDQLAKEKEELSKLEKIAPKLEGDADYAKLKNSTQRSLYLLSQYSIPSGQATKVIELVNMRKIVIDSGLTRIFEKGVESGEIKVE